MISLKSPMSALIKTSSLNVFLINLNCPFYKGLMRWKRKVKKLTWNSTLKKTKIMTFGPITSRQIEEGKVQAVSDFIFLDSKTTADGNCSQDIKRHLLPGRKTMTNLDSVLKSRNIILVTKVCIVKAMVFLVVMFECESWTIKKTECWKIDVF